MLEKENGNRFYRFTAMEIGGIDNRIILKEDFKLFCRCRLQRLTPYGHSVDEIAPDQELIMAAANVGVEAIKNFNGLIETLFYIWYINYIVYYVFNLRLCFYCRTFVTTIM